jgi:hypothetical protein
MSKEVQAIWISSMSGIVGIVLTDNGHEKKAYVKQVAGLNEEEDTKDVMENGGKLQLPEAQFIVDHLKAK